MGKRTAAVVVAGGAGRRLRPKRGALRKPYLILGTRPILIHTLKKLSGSILVDEIVVVCHRQDIGRCRSLIKRFKIPKIKGIVAGGRERFDSVFNGLKAIGENIDIVLIHDGVRPFLSHDLIKRSIEVALRHGASLAAVPVKPTVKFVDKKGFVVRTLKRDLLWEAQTPQAFKRELITKAYKRAGAKGVRATDDTALVERMGHKVRLVTGSYDNIKITTREDLKLAKVLLKDGR
ncbi:MAG: 2-C-methyl-D-erythritol 4-phosphate cytidylyltransferase [Candidatus Omnitrophica bacterium]|nr:2-C-methyl-D-erythritol 4-phosphate cytidylyltransferase [Candidatus Omnitrophota bacterium]